MYSSRNVYFFPFAVERVSIIFKKNLKPCLYFLSLCKYYSFISNLEEYINEINRVFKQFSKGRVN